MAPFAVSVLLAPHAALADGEPMRASMVTHEAFGWKFAPVIAQHQVRGFLGWNITNDSVGNNFTLTWFEPTTNGQWTASAWPAGTTKGEAVSGIAIMVEGFDPETIMGVVGADANEEPILPTTLQNGLVWNDPLQVIVASFPNPALIVSALADEGANAAQVLSAEMTEDPATPGEWPLQAALSSFAQRAETLMLNASASSSSTGFCYCTAVYGETCTPNPGATWVLEAVPAGGGGFKCIWRRDSTVAWWYTSSKFFTCNPCGAGGTVSAREVCIINVGPGETCPATPPTTCATSCTRN